ncbi:MAG: Crp/Fnr family transcriptional regulator [Bacteroidales bacterium]|nr:Crp/Fnr family transcriptional regulator [Bacteroidales bacterium]MCF8333794.1 Crp/Fnr family transcriptional regulator [Bacteroidales bacterium]
MVYPVDDKQAKELRDYLSQMVVMDDETFRAFLNIGRLETLRKGELFVEQGKYCRELCYVFSGYFRYYHIYDGREVTRDFIFSKTITTSFSSLITQTPSSVSIQALADCELFVFPYSRLLALYESYPKLERIARIHAEQAFISLERYHISHLNDSAKERYKKLIEREPVMAQKIPLQYLASFLSITPQHLSRIRRELFTDK